MSSVMGHLLVLSSLIFYNILSTLAISISTPAYLVVEEGMELRLDCKLNYQADTQIHNIKLDWYYMPSSDTKEDLIFFHYQNISVVVDNGIFFPRLQWVGDIGQNNGSILITEVECSDKGRFTCDMRIPRSSNVVCRSSIELMVLCKGIKHTRAFRPPESGELIPKNIIIYTTVGIFTFFVALSIILVIIWKKHSMHTAPRSQRRNDPGILEDSEDTNRYVTVSRRQPHLIDIENKEMEGKKNKESKTGEEEIYVTMRSFLGTGKSDDLPKPIVLSSGERSHQSTLALVWKSWFHPMSSN
ncbi:myelin protein P0-like isoform X2 [Heterodontus francisci]|uniref:myelin protein P0-like isoform X2 n=1 Tax=Heterodontus francisci TaxID=7792 RepID=UPI00355C7552